MVAGYARLLPSRSHMGNTQAKLRKDVDPAFLRPAGGYTYTGCTPPPPAPAIAHPWGPQGARWLTPFLARGSARVALCAAGEERTLRRMILERRLAPFYRGEDEPGAATDEREECPICMLFYPGGLNRANCCGQGLCSECWLQICPRANKQVK